MENKRRWWWPFGSSRPGPGRHVAKGADKVLTIPSGQSVAADIVRAAIKTAVEKDLGSEKSESYETLQIHVAARNGNLRKVKTLITENPKFMFCRDEDGTPLHHAAANGRLDGVE